MSISGYTSFGGNGLSRTAYETHTRNAGVFQTSRIQSLAAGADVRMGRYNGGRRVWCGSTRSIRVTPGHPQKTNTAGGGSAAAVLLGLGSSGALNYGASTAQLAPYYGFYFQDDFRVTSKLTLNLGLRYEWEGGRTERYNRFNRGFDRTAASPIESAAVANYAANPISEVAVSDFKVKGGLQFAGVGGVPRALGDADWNNIAPRIGAAYSLTSKTVLRGGWGLFFGPTSQESATTSGFSSSTTWVTTVDGGLTPVNRFSNPYPDGFIAPLGAGDGLMTQVGQGASFIDPSGVQLYAQRYQFSIQRQFSGQVLVEAATPESAVGPTCDSHSDFVPRNTGRLRERLFCRGKILSRLVWNLLD